MPPTDPPTPTFRLEYATRSDLGMRRTTNQDAVVAAPSGANGSITSDRVLMVADGMGAHAAGELASKMAVDCVPHAYLKSQHSAPSALRQAVREANRRIHAKGGSSPEFQGMGTTCSCLVLSPGAALVGHVGDSRVYRLRAGLLEQLTFDHSLVWEMAAASHVTEDKVPSCIPKNVITRSLGPQDTVNVDLEGPHDLADGDSYLICSDGLTGVVDDALAGAIIDAMPPDDAAQTLVDLANLRGGPDNISVVIARVAADDASRRPPAPGEDAWRGVAIGLAVIAVGLAAFGWFAARDNSFGMLLSAACCGAAAVVAAMMRSSAGGESQPRWSDGSYGNGPYRSVDCREPREAADALRRLAGELATLAADASAAQIEPADANGAAPTVAVLDWGPFAQQQQQADAAHDAGDARRAVLLYAELVRDVMQAIREDDATKRFRLPSSEGGSSG